MISLGLMFLAGIFKAVMDTLNFRFEESIFANKKRTFWNPQESWKNKWKNGDKSQGEKFWLSSTVLVSFTDAWHLFQSLCISCMVLAVVLYSPIVVWWVDFFILRAMLTITFEILFSKVFIK